MPPESRPSLIFRPKHRLSHNREFQAVYEARMRKSRGGLMVSTCPNTRPYHRLGLAVSSRTMPKAVDRSRAKRLVREAFRLSQQNYPLVPAPLADVAESDEDERTMVGLDIIVSVRTAKRMTLAACRTVLGELVAESAADWSKRAARS